MTGHILASWGRKRQGQVIAECLCYKSRHEIRWLQTEPADEPQVCPNTPVLDWMKPVIRPAHPALLEVPEVPLP